MCSLAREFAKEGPKQAVRETLTNSDMSRFRRRTSRRRKNGPRPVASARGLADAGSAHLSPRSAQNRSDAVLRQPDRSANLPVALALEMI